MKVAAKEGIVESRVAVFTSTPAATTTVYCQLRFHVSDVSKTLRLTERVEIAIDNSTCHRVNESNEHTPDNSFISH